MTTVVLQQPSASANLGPKMKFKPNMLTRTTSVNDRLDETDTTGGDAGGSTLTQQNNKTFKFEQSQTAPMTDSKTNNEAGGNNTIKNNKNMNVKKPNLNRSTSCPDIQYDDCREFDSFSGEWCDSKGQTVLISPWGVIRYPNNPKLRFEATYMGPNHLSVTFDKDPKKRKFIGKLNHDCELLIWSNDTQWVKKASKYDPQLSPLSMSAKSSSSNDSTNLKQSKHSKNKKSRSGSCLIQ